MQRIYKIDEIIANIIKNPMHQYTTTKTSNFKTQYSLSQKTQKDNFLLAVPGNNKSEKNRYTSSHRKNKQECKIRKENYLKELQNSWWIFSCPYCNKKTITHFEYEKWFKKLYDIEHFLPRSLYSSLSINLYNQLPACISCNQRLKKDINPLYENNNPIEIFHPYFWFIKSRDWKIDIEDASLDKKQSFSPFLDNEHNIKTHTLKSQHGKKFHLDHIYLKSEDTFRIFDFIYDKYTKIKDEYKKFKNQSKSVSDFIDHFLKNYYPKKEQDILKYNNGKYKKDLILHMQKILENELEGQ